MRYDGRHKRDDYLTEVLSRVVEWVPVCPEVEVGMGIPREPIRLVGRATNPRLIGEQSGTDWTEPMRRYALTRVKQLARLHLSGYILKKDSPSCGISRVRVYATQGARTGAMRDGRGLFARVLLEALPLLPVEDEDRLRDPVVRERFIERVFAYPYVRATARHARRST